MYMYLFILLNFLVSMSTHVSAGTCSTLSMWPDSFCFALNGTTVSSHYTNETINSRAITSAIKYTGGSCTDTACNETTIKGSATQACYDAIQTFFCLSEAGPKAEDSSSLNCLSPSVPYPMISDCENIFIECNDTKSANLDELSTCEQYSCANSLDCSNRTCSVATGDATGMYPTCTCGDNYMGVHCEYDRIQCPGDSLCSLHGSCNYFTGVCECDDLWSGEQCNWVPCKKGSHNLECSGHGACRSVGVCKCDAGYIGSACQIKSFQEGMDNGSFAGIVIAVLIGYLGIFGYFGRFLFIMCGWLDE